MKTKLSLTYILLIILILFESCRTGLSQENKIKVKIWCLRKNVNEIIYKIENKGDVSIYLPDNFWIQYFDNHDTLYFESIYKKKYGNRSFYFYNQFGDTYITGEAIDGLKADSLKNESIDYFDHQFKAPKLIELKPNKYVIKVDKHKKPLNFGKAIFRLYNSDFSLKNYTYSDFIEFEKEKSFLISTRIYEVISP